jgi:glycosyltransferase involved in cell wall biosynthesis
MIPAYNAERHIASTLSRVPAAIWQRIEAAVVIDDCSTDETVHKALDLANDYPKLRVIRHRTNRRYGGILKHGFQYAIDHGFDALLIVQADGRCSPESLPRLLEALEKGPAHVAQVVPVTPRPYEGPANRFSNRLLRRLSGLRLSDFQSGLRAYRVDFLRSVPFWNNTDDRHFDTEILLQSQILQATVLKVAGQNSARNDLSRGASLLHAIRSVLTTLRYALHRAGLFYSRNYDLNATGSRYGSKFADPFSSHSLLYGYLNDLSCSGKTVLELGVGDSALTRRLHADGAIVDCVEMDPEAAGTAAPYARHVWNEDLAVTRLKQARDSYDIVIAADILEHLLYPEEILTQLKACVGKGGVLLVSLPNVANLYVRINLLLGRFPYHSKGLLDRTHLHFFTRKSAERLVARAGWDIVGRDYTSIPVAVVFPFLLKSGFRSVLYVLRFMTRMFKGLLGYQFLLYCRNPNESDLL